MKSWRAPTTRAMICLMSALPDRRQGKAIARVLVDRELAAFAATKNRDRAAAWRSLERAHILAQPFLMSHGGIHVRMLRFAIELGDWREALGQVFRLLLVPIGNATGRLPVGNTGRANVSAFDPMPIPADLWDEMSGDHCAEALRDKS